MTLLSELNWTCICDLLSVVVLTYRDGFWQPDFQQNRREIDANPLRFGAWGGGRIGYREIVAGHTTLREFRGLVEELVPAG
ncbi:Ribosomal subunit interface protein [Altererythrobacter epoxidivorans]|uniref:Ribosomal subunit interface protein n=1 Tax=Altererythrobacter epoxidivorans TaxID=361183 RepID=A0A0M5KY44_9SPHN|nr:Ribosomal subunit interface protein [Altererythrobacter epoxidivorans]